MVALKSYFAHGAPQVIPSPPTEFWSQFLFNPLIENFIDFEVYDFSKSYDPNRTRSKIFGVGKYNEKRPTMYNQEMYAAETEARDIHMGIDLAAPEGTPVHAFWDGEIFLQTDNSQLGDYGPTLITRHRLLEFDLFALWGHLSRHSLSQRVLGEKFKKGEKLATVGSEDVNGGWNPHLHFQLSWLPPKDCNLPGVVSTSQLQEALLIFPDPQNVTGRFY
jgi:hypothetical protein